MKTLRLTFEIPDADWYSLRLTVENEMRERGIIPTDQDVVDKVSELAAGALRELVALGEKVERRDALIASGDIHVGRPSPHLRLVP